MRTKLFSLFLIGLFLSSCNSSESEENVLENVSSEILLFEFIPDTGNNSSILRYEIEFTNPNDVAVTGSYTINFETEGIGWSRSSTNVSPCTQIGANSNCTITFEEEGQVDPGTPDSIRIASIEYRIQE